MSVLRYVSHARVEDLAVGECTIHRASSDQAHRWWLLWFKVLRDTDGQPEVFCVPVALSPYTEAGPGGRTWQITCPIATAFEVTEDTKNWQITPSINVLELGNAVAGYHPSNSIWHQTPAIVGVPADELWTTGANP